MSARGLMWASDHMPLSWGEIRPSGKTAVDSTNVKPGPREAIPPTGRYHYQILMHTKF
jgi:hypothetical protein